MFRGRRSGVLSGHSGREPCREAGHARLMEVDRLRRAGPDARAKPPAVASLRARLACERAVGAGAGADETALFMQLARSRRSRHATTCGWEEIGCGPARATRSERSRSRVRKRPGRDCSCRTQRARRTARRRGQREGFPSWLGIMTSGASHCAFGPCKCTVEPAGAFEYEGKTYCSQRCVDRRGCDHAHCKLRQVPESGTRPEGRDGYRVELRLANAGPMVHPTVTEPGFRHLGCGSPARNSHTILRPTVLRDSGEVEDHIVRSRHVEDVRSFKKRRPVRFVLDDERSHVACPKLVTHHTKVQQES
jgi:hypothetical protein